MIEANEVVPGVWVFRGAPDGRSWGVALDGGRAMVIDPPVASVALDAIDRFVAESGSVIEVVAHTSSQEAASGVGRWLGAALLNPTMFDERRPLPTPADGWEAVPFYSQEHGSRMGIYNVWERVLFCGEMLSDIVHNEGIPSLADGSRGYIDSLKAVERLDLKLLVPRLGTPAQGKRAIRARIDNDNNYVYDVRSRVISSILSEVSLPRVLEVTRSVYGDFPFLEEHLSNIRYVWDELSAKEDVAEA